MPAGKGKKPTCELCCDSLEKHQETLICEGDCGCHVHRYCAGVTKRYYEELTNGSAPFICQWCRMKTSLAIIQQLQSEVASLKAELVEAKETIIKQGKELELIPKTEKTYASAAAQQPSHSSQPPHLTRRNTRRSGRPQDRPRTTHQKGSTNGDQSKERSKSSPRIVVEGARRIWNTYIHATSKTIENAIARFCNVEGLQIKRKTRMNGRTGKLIWWFIVHGDESKLLELDNKWECLHTQASWVLQPCTKPANEANNSIINPITELQSTPVNVNHDISKDPPEEGDGVANSSSGNPHQATNPNASSASQTAPAPVSDPLQQSCETQQ